MLKASLDAAIDRLNELINAINRTNSLTLVNGQTLCPLIAQMNGSSVKIGQYKSIVQAYSRINLENGSNRIVHDGW